ncbi:hypothetical protein LCGC14_2176400 [marine sediment metagenome]|uniref:Uncharacterized protein n=1 Tax=marine sediment metagenome TaxID=412755 RepID=A0A0F9G195_9ZZZZ
MVGKERSIRTRIKIAKTKRFFGIPLTGSKPKKKFIKKIGLKKGALSRQLNIPQEKEIPMMLLNRIIKAKAGDTIMNPTMIGKRRIKVTRLLERRAIFARTLKRLPKRK